jgi:hypothetical protein
MENVKNKIKLLEIAQQLKKDNISYNKAKEEILNLDNKEFICCDNIEIEEQKCKYPAGLPLETIYISYCINCNKIHDVLW